MAVAIFHGLRQLLSVRFFRWALTACAFLLAAGIVLILAALFPEVQQLRVVPLHYNIHVGVDKVGTWWQLFTPSSVGIVLTMVNVGYAARTWTREKVVSYAAMITAVVLDVIILLHVVFIVLLNLAYYA